MRKKFTSLFVVLLTGNLYSQVGIGTDNPKSTLQIEGSFQTKFREINQDYELINEDQIIQAVNTTTETLPITLILPSFSLQNAPLGRRYTIKNANTDFNPQDITLATTGSELINFNDNAFHSNNVSSIILKPGEAIEIVRTSSINGSTWSVIGYNQNDTFYSTDGTLTEQRTVTLENDASLMYFSNNVTNSDDDDGTPNFLIGNQTESIFSVNNITGKVIIGSTPSGRSSRANTIPLPSVTSPQKFTVFGDVRFTGLPQQSGNVVPVVIDNNGVLKLGTPTESGTSYTFTNGLTQTTGTVKLGGLLTEQTTIETGPNAGNKLIIKTALTDGFSVDGSTLSVDGKNHRIGIGTTAPSEALHVTGKIKANSLAYSTNYDDIPVVVNNDGVLKRGAFPTITAINGLTKNGNNIELGGTLNKPTSIQTSSTNTLKLLGLQQGNTTSDDVLTRDTNGVVKYAKISDIKGTSNTFQNGLTKNNNNDIVKLGGNLNTPTTIGTSSINTLALTGLSEGDAKDDKVLVVNSSGVVRAVTTITNDLAIPTPAVFTLENDINDFLKTTGWGFRFWIPMKPIVNAIPGLTVDQNSGKTILNFSKGVYQVTMVYEASGNEFTNCTLSSYFVDFPFVGFNINENHGHLNNPNGNPNRVHSTASHVTGSNSNHGGTISFTFVANDNVKWAINLGRGQSGNCNNTPGVKLEKTSTQLTVFRLGDAP